MIFKKKSGQNNIVVYTDEYTVLGLISVQTGLPDKRNESTDLIIVIRDFTASMDFNLVSRDEYKFARSFAYQMNMKFRNKKADEWAKVSFETQNSELVEMECPIKIKGLLRLW